MPDYKKMYKKLFNAYTDAIRILQKAQQEAEEEYINSSEEINISGFSLVANDNCNNRD